LLSVLGDICSCFAACSVVSSLSSISIFLTPMLW
jgi:hypothetical protein